MILLKSLLLEIWPNIVKMGYPDIIAKMLDKKFGNKSSLIAKWYKDYVAVNRQVEDWWQQAHTKLFGSGLGLRYLVELYNSTHNRDQYLKTLKRLDLSTEEFEKYYDNSELYLEEKRNIILHEIEDTFFKSPFFKYYSIISDIISGKLKDVAPYKSMDFDAASLKYEESKFFSKIPPIKTYDDGYSWINVGKYCHLISHFMKNCGSVGLMSSDEKRTMLGLFDSNHKPHVVVTYSPTENRISGDQGIASSAVKPEYHDYILDLTKQLGARFDHAKSDSKLLKLKYILRDKGFDIKQLNQGTLYTSFDEYFRFKMDGKVYYTDSFYVLSLEDIQKAHELVKSGKVTLRNNQRNRIKDAFNHLNRDILKHYGINYIYLNNVDQLQNFTIANTLNS
jgi:hypothetical protein